MLDEENNKWKQQLGIYSEHEHLLNDHYHFSVAFFPSKRETIHFNRNIVHIDLVETLWWSHGWLDVQWTDVLPVLLEQWYQEIDWQVNVLDQFILGHVNVTNSNGKAQHL